MTCSSPVHPPVPVSAAHELSLRYPIRPDVRHGTVLLRLDGSGVGCLRGVPTCGHPVSRCGTSLAVGGGADSLIPDRLIEQPQLAIHLFFFKQKTAYEI